jgi:hypothetical protein
MSLMESGSVSQALPESRAAFIRKTYLHVALAVGLFVLAEVLLWGSPIHQKILELVSSSQYAWLGVLAAFMLIGWLARSLAANVRSQGMQYLGLALYVVAQAIIFLPLITLALIAAPEGTLLKQALVVTGFLFTGLTAVVLFTRRDFSFLRTGLMVGGFVALGLIIAGSVFGFNLGLAFSGGMILLASGAILYDTSKVLHHYPEDAHVGAALEIFASIALLFWYVLQFIISMNRD